MEHATFYSTAAQVIPVLLVLGVIESRLVNWKGLVRDVDEMGEVLMGGTVDIESILRLVWKFDFERLSWNVLVLIIRTPLMWVLVLLAGEVAAFLALWLGDNVILAVITGVSLGYGMLLVLAGSAVHLLPSGRQVRPRRSAASRSSDRPIGPLVRRRRGRG